MIRLVLSNLRFYWRTHLGVLLGAMCATAVLVGAMAVGDSVRLSLADQARNRIGGVDVALLAGDRTVTTALADSLGRELHRDVASVLALEGIARRPTGTAEASGTTTSGIAHVLGVDARFFALSPGQPGSAVVAAPAAGKAYLNPRLARQLGVGVGDQVLLRIAKPSFLPRDMMVATVDDISFALRVEVERIVGDPEFGRFGLRASQIPPFNVFVALPWLQEQLDLGARANLLLAGGASSGSEGVAELVAAADAAVQKHWRLADAGLQIRTAGGMDELTSRRIFLDRPITAAVRELAPTALGVLTYFVDDLKLGGRSTPYSTVSAIGPLTPAASATPPLAALAPPATDPEGIHINRWLADDLGAKVGDTITLDYQVLGPQLHLKTATGSFTLRRVLPLSGAAADPTLMPAFPGIADSENCRDWEPGIPIAMDRIRETDETYWDEHRGTPKAFVSLAAGQALFANRFGDLTAIRGPTGFGQVLETRLPAALSPASLGLFFRDIRTPTLAAGTSSTDFGGLFLGLSFFLIGAALLLTAMLFAFGVEQRANEIGTLLAVGWSRSRVRRLFLLESAVLAILGGLLGAGLGLAYTQAVLIGLGTLWREAIGTTTLAFHAPVTTVALGTTIAIAVALGAIAWTLRRVFDRSAVELLQSRNGIPSAAADGTTKSGRTSLVLATVCPIAAVGLALAAGSSATQAAGLFFGAGAILLVGGLALCRRLLGRFGEVGRSGIASVGELALRNAGRRPGRSLATIALLASGTFLVVAVQANRLEPPPDAAVRSSGTGGFALFGRSTLPVLRDLGTEAGRTAFGLDDSDLAGARILPLRVREGDDASCLNLSLAQNPRLVGVEPEALASRGAFSFTATGPPAGEPAPESGWSLLDADYGEDVVPAIGDAASITWALHKNLGDTLTYTDEAGATFRVRLVGAVGNSILQGNLVIAARHLRARFPSASGYRMFLIDAPPGRVPAVASRLTVALEDVGLELTPTRDRLRAFQAVQNTYLLIFQVLGGLGLLLGSLGVGMVVLRNALERRSELALLTAVGFSRATVRRLVWREHAVLLLLGLATGVAAAVFALLPVAADLSLLPMLVLVVAVALSGLVWVRLASDLATRGPLLTALQDD